MDHVTTNIAKLIHKNGYYSLKEGFLGDDSSLTLVSLISLLELSSDPISTPCVNTNLT